jgi:uncharacterized protein (DUF433 family)
MLSTDVRRNLQVTAHPIPIDPAYQDELVRERIERDPFRPWPAEARLVSSATPVWAIIGYLRVANWSVPVVAAGYNIVEADVLAAVAFYYQHRAAIDARLEANDYAARDTG